MGYKWLKLVTLTPRGTEMELPICRDNGQHAKMVITQFVGLRVPMLPIRIAQIQKTPLELVMEQVFSCLEGKAYSSCNGRAFNGIIRKAVIQYPIVIQN